MPKWLQKVLIGLAIGLGTGLFILWKVVTHDKNLKDARYFMHVDPRDVPGKAKVLDDLDVQGRTLEEKAQSLRDEVEEQTREEIINAFKKAFHVAGNDRGSGNMPAVD